MSNDYPPPPRDGGRPVPPPPPPPPAGARPVEPFAVPDSPYGTPGSPYGAPTHDTPTYGAPTYGAPAYGAPAYGAPAYGAPAYGAPAYGTPAYGTPAYGTPTSSPADAAAGRPRRNGVALSALMLGVVSLLLAWLSQVTVVAVPVAALALVVGVVSAVRARRRASGGVGAAVAGAGLAVLAVLLVGLTSAGSSADLDLVPGAGDSPAGDASGGDGPAGDGVPVPPWQPLTVADVAYGPDPDDPGAWWYVVVVDNPNPDHRFDFAEMTVEALAADGTLITSQAEYAAALPGRVAVSGTFYDLGGLELDRVDVRLPVVQDVTYAPDGGALTAGDLTATASTWGVTVTGTVASTLAQDAEMVRVVVVATAPDGEILGAAHGYVEELASDGEGAFEADFFSELPAGTRYTAYPAL